MRLMHLSDLHLGIKVYEYDLFEDQKYMLDRLIDIALDQDVDGVLISGDIYDRPIPPAESVTLFDSFLTSLSNNNIKAYITSGNHDSQERLAFGARLMDKSGIYFGGAFSGEVKKIDLEDEFGPLHIYMLPFLKPSIVRATMPDQANAKDDNKEDGNQKDDGFQNENTDTKEFKYKEDIKSYQDALSFVLDNCSGNEGERNVIMAHQFVTGAERSDSEEINVGGLDEVSSSVFDKFDYVALGHIHTPQVIGGQDHIRYCGTMLKYSFSECKKDKSVPIVTFKEKGNIKIELVKLTPLRDMRQIRGTYMDLTSKKNYVDTNTMDYLHVTLTDEEDIPDAMARLRAIYPNIMKLDYDNLRTKAVYTNEIPDQVDKKSPLELFEEFYNLQNGRKFTEEESEYVQSKIDELWEGGM